MSEIKEARLVSEEDKVIVENLLREEISFLINQIASEPGSWLPAEIKPPFGEENEYWESMFFVVKEKAAEIIKG